MEHKIQLRIDQFYISNQSMKKGSDFKESPTPVIFLLLL